MATPGQAATDVAQALMKQPLDDGEEANLVQELVSFLELREVDAEVITSGLVERSQSGRVALRLSYLDTVESVRDRVMEASGASLSAACQKDEGEVVVYGLEDCSPSGVQNPSWKPLTSDARLQSSIKVWFASAEVHKAKMFAAGIEGLIEQMSRFWDLGRDGRGGRSMEEQSELAQLCNQVWRMLASKQAATMNMYDQIFELLLQPLVLEVEPSAFKQSATPLCLAVLGTLWASCNNSRVRKRFVRHTDLVKNLFSLLRDNTVRGSMRDESRVVLSVLGCLSAVICDESVRQRFASTEFVAHVDLLLWVIKRSQDEGHLNYVSACGRVLCHILVSDHAFDSAVAFREKCLAELLDTLVLDQETVLPSYLLCVSTVLANYARRRDFCRRFVKRGHLESLLGLVDWLLATLSSGRMLQQLTARGSRVDCEGVAGSAGLQSFQMNPTKVLLETLLRCFSVLWACCKARRPDALPHVEHYCNYYHSGRCGFLPHEAGDQDPNEDSATVDLSAERFQAILARCLKPCREGLTRCIVNMASARGTLESIQGCGLGIAAMLLGGVNELRQTLDAAELVDMLDCLALKLREGPVERDSGSPTLACSSRSRSFYFVGARAVGGAMCLFQTALRWSARCQSAFAFCKANYETLSRTRRLQRSYIEFLARVALLGKRLAIDKAGLAEISRHVQQEIARTRGHGDAPSPKHAATPKRSVSALKRAAKSVIQNRRVNSLVESMHLKEQRRSCNLSMQLAAGFASSSGAKAGFSTLSPVQLKLRFGLSATAVGTANAFLNRMRESVTATKELQQLVEWARVLASAAAFAKGPQSSDLLDVVLELVESAPVRPSVLCALWYLARDDANRRALSQRGAVEVLMGVLSASRVTPEERVRALDALWLLLYDPVALDRFVQHGGLDALSTLLAASAVATGATFKAIQILRVCAGAPARLGSEFESNKRDSLLGALAQPELLHAAWNLARAHNQPTRIRCAAASLVMMLPIPDAAAERSIIALLKVLLDSRLDSRVSRRERACLVRHAASFFAHVQFSPKGHELLRRLQIIKLLLLIAIETSRELMQPALETCRCRRWTEQTSLATKCMRCGCEGELRAVLVGLHSLACNGSNQVELCQEGLVHFLQMAWSTHDPQLRKIFRAILTKLSSHPANHTVVYDLELLARKALCFGKSSASASPADKPGSDVGLGFLLPAAGTRGAEEDNEKRRAFLAWFAELSTPPPVLQTEGDKDAKGKGMPSESVARIMSDLKGQVAERQTVDIWQTLREPRSQLWTMCAQEGAESDDRSVRRWNPSVKRLESSGATTVLELGDVFPHATYKFSHEGTNVSIPISQHDRERFGICDMAMFPHVEGSRVYQRLGMSAFPVSSKPALGKSASASAVGARGKPPRLDDLSAATQAGPGLLDERVEGSGKSRKPKKEREREVFVYRNGGGLGDLNSSDGTQEHLFGTPDMPVRLVDVDRCCQSLDESTTEPVEIAQLVDLDVLPKPMPAPAPKFEGEGSPSYDEELALHTAFPLQVCKLRHPRKIRSVSIAKIQSVMMLNAKRNSFLAFQTQEAHSVFAARKTESDSRHLLGVNELAAGEAFRVDWAVCMQRKPFHAFMLSIAVRDSTDKGKKESNVPAMLEKIGDFLESNYRTVCLLHRFYSSQAVIDPDQSEPQLESLDCMPLEQISQMVRDFEVASRAAPGQSPGNAGGSQKVSQNMASRDLTKQLALNIFSRGIVSKQLSRTQRQAVRKCKAISFGRKSGLHRHGLLEFLLRLADAKYFPKDESTSPHRSMVASLRRLFKDLGALVDQHPLHLDTDRYRKARLYNIKVDELHRKNLGVLEELFQGFAGVSRNTKAWGGSKGQRMTLPEWLGALEHCNVLSPYFTFREAAVLFKASLFEVADIAQDWERHLSLTFTGFLEAISRLADAFFLPADFQLERWQFKDVTEFYSFASRIDVWDLVCVSSAECVNDYTKLPCWADDASPAGPKDTANRPDVVQTFYKLSKLLAHIRRQAQLQHEGMREILMWGRYLHGEGGSSEEHQFEWYAAEALHRLVQGSAADHEPFDQLSREKRFEYVMAVRLPCEWMRARFKERLDAGLDHSARAFSAALQSPALQAAALEALAPRFTSELCAADAALKAALDAYARSTLAPAPDAAAPLASSAQ